MNELRQVCQEQHNQIVLYLGDIERFDRRVKEYEVELNKERGKSGELNRKLTVVEKEMEKITKETDRLMKELNGSVGKKAKEYDELQEKFARLSMKSRST